MKKHDKKKYGGIKIKTTDRTQMVTFVIYLKHRESLGKYQMLLLADLELARLLNGGLHFVKEISSKSMKTGAASPCKALLDKEEIWGSASSPDLAKLMFVPLCTSSVTENGQEDVSSLGPTSPRKIHWRTGTVRGTGNNYSLLG